MKKRERAEEKKDNERARRKAWGLKGFGLLGSLPRCQESVSNGVREGMMVVREKEARRLSGQNKRAK